MLILNGKPINEGDYIIRTYYDETVGYVVEVNILAMEGSIIEPQPDAVETPSATGLDTETINQNLPSRFSVDPTLLEQVRVRSVLRNSGQGKLNRDFPFGTTPLRHEVVTVASSAYNIQDVNCIDNVVGEIVEKENNLQYDTEVATVGIVDELSFVLQGDGNTFFLEERLNVLKQ